MKEKERKGSGRLLCFLSVLAVCAYPCLFQYAQNVSDVDARFMDAVVFFGVFVAIAIILLAVFLVIFRNMSRASVMTGLSMLVVINFGLLDTALKARFSWFRSFILLAVLGLVLLVIMVVLLKKKWNCKSLCLLFLVVFGGLSVVNMATAVPAILQRMQPVANHTAAAESAVANTPNVYYFIFDEYGGPECLAAYYDYDSSEFYGELQQRGFATSASSYNTESTSTATIVPNLFGLAYDSPRFDYEDGTPTPLVQQFLDMGYEANFINHFGFLDPDGGKELTKNQSGDSLCSYLYSNSILWMDPLNRVMRYLPQLQYELAYTDMLMDVLDKLEAAPEYVGKEPTVTFGYVMFPHPNFVMDAEGNPLQEEDYVNWKDPEIYLGQLEYTNKLILRMVDKIIAQDSEAVIILQSDHGARLLHHLYERYDIPYEEEDCVYQKNILNCVYLGGEAVDIEGMNGINTLRAVLNRVYGTDYEMLEPIVRESGPAK